MLVSQFGVQLNLPLVDNNVEFVVHLLCFISKQDITIWVTFSIVNLEGKHQFWIFKSNSSSCIFLSANRYEAGISSLSIKSCVTAMISKLIHICNFLGAYQTRMCTRFLVQANSEWFRHLQVCWTEWKWEHQAFLCITYSDCSNVCYMSYSEVTGVSPSTGSVMGGTLLTVHGHFFDQTDRPARVLVGGNQAGVSNEVVGT